MQLRHGPLGFAPVEAPPREDQAHQSPWSRTRGDARSAAGRRRGCSRTGPWYRTRSHGTDRRASHRRCARPRPGRGTRPRCGQNASARHMRPLPSIQATIFSPIHSRWKSPACSITWRGAMRYQPSGNGDGRGASRSSLRRVVMGHRSAGDPLAATEARFPAFAWSLLIQPNSDTNLTISPVSRVGQAGQLARSSPRPLRGRGRTAGNRPTRLAYQRTFRHNVDTRRP